MSKTYDEMRHQGYALISVVGGEQVGHDDILRKVHQEIVDTLGGLTLNDMLAVQEFMRTLPVEENNG